MASPFGEANYLEKSEEIYLDQLAQAYINAKKAEGQSLKRLKEFAAIINKVLIPEFGHRPVESLKLLELVTFMGKRYADCSQVTRNRYLSYLKVMFNFGIKYLDLKTNPLVLWRKAKERPRQCLLTIEDLGKIMAVAPEHLRRALTLWFLTAVRPGASEMLALRAEHVDLARREIKVYASKTRTWREVDNPRRLYRDVPAVDRGVSVRASHRASRQAHVGRRKFICQDVHLGRRRPMKDKSLSIASVAALGLKERLAISNMTSEWYAIISKAWPATPPTRCWRARRTTSSICSASWGNFSPCWLWRYFA